MNPRRKNQLKKRRVGSPLTDARREQLKEQLARGRATSLAKRRNNGKLKKLAKAKDLVKDEEDIVLSTKTAAELRAELKALKEEIKQEKQMKKEIVKPAPASSEKPKVLKAEVIKPKTPVPVIEVKPEPVNTGPPAWLLKRKNNKYL